MSGGCGGFLFFFLKTVRSRPLALNSPFSLSFLVPSGQLFWFNAGVVGLPGATALARFLSTQAACDVGSKALPPPIGNIPLCSNYAQQALVREMIQIGNRTCPIPAETHGEKSLYNFD